MAAKRKRPQPSLSGGPNPHSYSNETLKQLRLAGLDPDNDIPASLGGTINLFPHRPLANGLAADDTSDGYGGLHISSSPGLGTGDRWPGGKQKSAHHDDAAQDGLYWSTTDVEEDGDSKPSRLKRQEEEGRRWKGVGKGKEKSNRERTLHPRAKVLRAIIDRSLQTGNIERAKKAWATLLRTDLGGRSLDIRDGGLWCLGAEILMRDGEDPPQDAQDDSPAQKAAAQHNHSPFLQNNVSNPPRRWGRPENLVKVKTYYDALSRRYPYTFGEAWRPSSLDFEESKFACEIYNAQVEHRIACWKVDMELGPPKKSRWETERAAAAAAKQAEEKKILDELQADLRAERPESIEGDDDGFRHGKAEEEGLDDDLDFRAYQEQYGEEDNLDYTYHQYAPPSNQEAAEQAVAEQQAIKAEGYDSTAFHKARDKLDATAVDIVKDIAARMDHVMVAHPFSNSYSLLRLRGMLALWTADLYIPSRRKTITQQFVLGMSLNNTLEGKMERLVVGDEDDAGSQEGEEGFQQRRGRDRELELDKAREMFSRIDAAGGFVEPMYLRFARQRREARERQDFEADEGDGGSLGSDDHGGTQWAA